RSNREQPSAASCSSPARHDLGIEAFLLLRREFRPRRTRRSALAPRGAGPRPRRPPGRCRRRCARPSTACALAPPGAVGPGTGGLLRHQTMGTGRPRMREEQHSGDEVKSYVRRLLLTISIGVVLMAGAATWAFLTYGKK